MSTRCSIAYDQTFHVYSEMFDSGGVYVELEGYDVDFEVYPGRITVRIPKNVMETILANSDKIRERLNSSNELESEE